MSGEPEIKVKKPVSVLHKEIKVNPKSLFMFLGKAAINGAFLKWDELAKSGVEVLDALGLEAEPGEVASAIADLVGWVKRSETQHRENRRWVSLLVAALEILVKGGDNASPNLQPLCNDRLLPSCIRSSR